MAMGRSAGPSKSMTNPKWNGLEMAYVGEAPPETAEEHAANATQILRAAKQAGTLTPRVVADAHTRLHRALQALSEGRY